MKTKFTTFVIAILSVFFVSVPAFADNDRPITVKELPAAAQQIVSKYFGGKKVALAKLDNDLLDKSYDIIFTDGCKLEFNSKGEWTEIACPGAAVPAELVPAAIKQFVETNYAGTTISKIERDRTEYEVKLSDGMEITFNKKFQVTDIDR